MNRNIITALLCGLAALSVTGCTGEVGGLETSESTNELTLNFTIPGSMSVSTYGVAGTESENYISHIYLLFFDPSGTYATYARAGVGTSSTSGSTRITMPDGYKIEDEWDILFVANLDSFVEMPEGLTDIGDWFDLKLGGLSLTDAWVSDDFLATATTAVRSPLPMSGKSTKEANENTVSVEFARRVARIDVVNNSSSNFRLVSAQVWNARINARLGNGFIAGDVSTNNFTDYTDNVATPASGSGEISGQLYAFPNESLTIATGDYHTTCLIIGGQYNNGPTTYYRVNVCASSQLQQQLNANSIYTIKITNVVGDGEASPGDAHNKENLQISYIINEWDDSYSVLYVFDEWGNALGVSQRFINFSYRGPQNATVNVYRLYSDDNPLTGDWTVDNPTGTYYSSFTSAKNPTGSSVTIGVVDENTLSVDRDAKVYLHWGTIDLPLELTQLSFTSQLDNALVSPTTLSFALLGASPKQLTVSLQGDFAGVTRSDIETAFIYHDSNDTGWLHIAEGSTADDEALGLFYFNVWPDDYNDYTDGVRQAEIRFVIRVGTRLTTAHVDVYQSPDSFGDGELRIVEILCMEYDDDEGEYLNRGATSSLAAKMPGLPVGQNTANHLHFRMVGSKYIKYIMYINSSLDWEIVASGVTEKALSFTPSSGTGDYAHAVEVEITAVSDVDWGWDGVFYVQYADGQTTPVVVHQTGIMASSASGEMFYYGLMRLNGKLWLDRNVGATAPMDADDPTAGYYNPVTDYLDTNAAGFFYYHTAAHTACPAGFRLPKYSATGETGEWDWVYNNLVYSNNIDDGNHPESVWFVAYGAVDNPRYWYLPIAGNGYRVGYNNQGNFWVDNVDYPYDGSLLYYLRVVTSATTGTKAISYQNLSNTPIYQYSVRCVYESEKEYPDEP
ncbi:MAG: hypothetical protein LIO85_07385 [Rikenellaceae bacterium]|nr:hypothetical protein [Rikenellaceae bacterium]